MEFFILSLFFVFPFFFLLSIKNLLVSPEQPLRWRFGLYPDLAV